MNIHGIKQKLRRANLMSKSFNYPQNKKFVGGMINLKNKLKEAKEK